MTNEAADRLRDWLMSEFEEEPAEMLDAALATERQETLRQLRARKNVLILAGVRPEIAFAQALEEMDQPSQRGALVEGEDR